MHTEKHTGTSLSKSIHPRHNPPAWVGNTNIAGQMATFFFLLFVHSTSGTELSAPLKMVYVDVEMPSAHENFNVFRKELNELRVDERNLHFVGVPGVNQAAYAAELVAKIAVFKPDLVLATGTIQAEAVRSALPTVAMLFLSNVNPINLRLVDSLGVRNANRTGVSFYQPIEAKQLEILKICSPKIRSVAVLVDQPLAAAGDMVAYATAGATLGVKVEVIVRESSESSQAIAKLLSSVSADAWLIPPTGLAVTHRQVLLAHFKANPTPVLYSRSKILEMGGLLAFDDTLNNWHRVWAKQVMLFSKGVPLNRIPVERPTGYDFGINLTAAKQLKNPLSKSCLFRATHFVE